MTYRISRKIARPIPVVMAVLTLSFTTAFAQQQSHIDAAKELLELMNADQSIDQAYDQMTTQFAGMWDHLGLPDEQRPMFDRHMEKMVQIMKEEMSWEKMEPYLLDAYVSVYSEEELREINEFYASPLGQKFVAKMPELIQASMKMSQDMMTKLIPRLREAQQELMAEAAAERDAAQTAD